MPLETAIVAADGYPLGATVYPAAGSGGRVALVHGAMAVRQRYYARFARFLADRGWTVLTYDYRGIGASRDGPQRGRDMQLADWGRLDVDAATRWAVDELDPARLVGVCHSCGGQVLGLASSCGRLDAAVFVAVQHGYWRHWPWPEALGVLALWYLAIPLLATWGDAFPARTIGFARDDIPAGVAREWARWGRSEGYLFDPAHRLDTARYGRLAIPILAYGIADDAYAPPDAAEAILAEYAAADVERVRLEPNDLGRERIGHFGFFREGMADPTWERVATWLADPDGRRIGG